MSSAKSTETPATAPALEKAPEPLAAKPVEAPAVSVPSFVIAPPLVKRRPNRSPQSCASSAETGGEARSFRRPACMSRPPPLEKAPEPVATKLPQPVMKLRRLPRFPRPRSKLRRPCWRKRPSRLRRNCRNPTCRRVFPPQKRRPMLHPSQTCRPSTSAGDDPAGHGIAEAVATAQGETVDHQLAEKDDAARGLLFLHESRRLPLPRPSRR